MVAFSGKCCPQIFGVQFSDVSFCSLLLRYVGYAPHSGTPADTENYTLLLMAVRTKLKALGSNRFGKPYGLSAGTVLSFNVVANCLTEVKCINFTALNIFTASLKHYHVVRIKSIKFKSTRSRHT